MAADGNSQVFASLCCVRMMCILVRRTIVYLNTRSLRLFESHELGSKGVDDGPSCFFLLEVHPKVKMGGKNERGT